MNECQKNTEKKQYKPRCHESACTSVQAHQTVSLSTNPSLGLCLPCRCTRYGSHLPQGNTEHKYEEGVGIVKHYIVHYWPAPQVHEALDSSVNRKRDCTHPTRCNVESVRKGCSSCAGNHLIPQRAIDGDQCTAKIPVWSNGGRLGCFPPKMLMRGPWQQRTHAEKMGPSTFAEPRAPL